MSTTRSSWRRLGTAALAAGAVAAAVLTLAPAADAAPARGYIRGVVTGADGRPLAGVQVTVGHFWQFIPPRTDVYGTAVTDADGRYRAPVEIGEDTLRVQFTAANATGGTSATGYADQCFGGSADCLYGGGSDLTLTAGQTISGVSATLAKAGEIRGRAVDSAGRSIGGLPVTLKNNGACFPFDDASPVGYATTDVNGNYAFLRLPAETITVCLGAGSAGSGGPSPYGYLDRALDVTPRTGLASRPVTPLREAGGIAGQVVDSSGAAIVGASVDVVDRFGSAANATTNAAGSFRVLGAYPGSQLWCVSAPGYVGTCDAGSPRVTIRSNTTTNVGKVVLRRAS